MPVRTPRRRDDDERNALALANDGLAWRFSRHFTGYGLDEDDLLQEGRIGLLAAARDYDPARAKFSTHAVRRVMAYCIQATKQMGSTIRLPAHRIDRGERPPVVERLDGHAVAAPEDDGRQSERDAAEERVNALLAQLDPSDADLIRRRWGLGGRKRETQVVIAAKAGVSKQAICVREQKAMAKLKALQAG